MKFLKNMSKLTRLERQLKKLTVKPSLGFRLKLSLRLLKISFLNNPLMVRQFSLAVTSIVLILSLTTGVLYAYNQSYTSNFRRAQNYLTELDSLISSSSPQAYRFIPVARASSISPDPARVSFLSAQIVYETAQALSKINKLSNIDKLNYALLVVAELHKEEVRVFAKAIEAVDDTDTVISVSQAIAVTNYNIKEVKRAVAAIETVRQNQPETISIAINLKPKVKSDELVAVNLSDEPESNPATRRLETNKLQKEVEDKLINIIKKNETKSKPKVLALKESTPIQSPSETEPLSENYIKARQYLDTGNYDKAYGLMSAAAAQGQLVEDQNNNQKAKTPVPEANPADVEPNSSSESQASQPESIAESVSESDFGDNDSGDSDDSDDSEDINSAARVIDLPSNINPPPPAGSNFDDNGFQSQPDQSSDQPPATILQPADNAQNVLPGDQPKSDTPALDKVKEILTREGKIEPPPPSAVIPEPKKEDIKPEPTPPAKTEPKPEENKTPAVTSGSSQIITSGSSQIIEDKKNSQPPVTPSSPILPRPLNRRSR